MTMIRSSWESLCRVSSRLGEMTRLEELVENDVLSKEYESLSDVKPSGVG